MSNKEGISKSAKLAKERKTAVRLPPEEDPEFQIAPMIDVLLVMLVFFMSISTAEITKVNKEIELPVAEDANPAGENPGQIVVNVDWNEGAGVGGIEVNEQTLGSPEELYPIITRNLAVNPLVRVLVRVDKRVRYDFTRNVMRVIGEAGISNITFSVLNKEEQ